MAKKMIKYSIEDLSESLEAVGVSNGDSVLAHSAIQNLGVISGSDIESIPTLIIDALLERIGKSGTLLMPSFSWDFPKTKHCDLRESKSKMGILTECFRKMHGVRRSFHPMYSFCATGNRSDYLTNYLVPEYHPFKKESVMGRLYDDNAVVLFVGTDIRYCTFMVYCEFQCGIEYRFEKPFRGLVIGQNGLADNGEFYHFCRPQSEKIEEDYLRIKERLLKDGILKSIPLGMGEICSFRTRPFFDSVKKYLKEDPWILLKQKPLKLYGYSNGQEFIRREIS